ncbi:hypothetical protein C8N46_102455 [Kordia periserrulae]|uniref:Uncharacterized protein n=1 Tax=Kordia periserrulae TaxID=701523 RepID=A0A2T6C421_9FLAO|nr:hypothetical protein C8N46_102455 [Kordia periserrulae]
MLLELFSFMEELIWCDVNFNAYRIVYVSLQKTTANFPQ